MLSSVVVVALSVWVAVCEGYSSGAPTTACDDMTPKHKGIPVQTTPHRYVVRTHKTDGGRVRVSITSEVGEELQGFALQARSASDLSRPVRGRFSEREGVHRITDCPRGPMVTHVSPADKREVLTEWTPDAGEEDQDVVFRATVLKDFSMFWTEVDSKPVRLGAGGSGVSNRARPQPKKENQSASGSSSSFTSRLGRCSVSRGCLGLPAGCVGQGNCLALLSYGADPQGGVAFELSGPLKPRSYMAVGFSLDAKMGDDFVIDCIRMDGSNVLVRESWNSGKSNTPLNPRDLDRRRYTTQFVDGMTTCSWTSDLSFDFNGIYFDLENSTYLLLAEGQMKDNEEKQYHRANRIATPSVVNFMSFKLLGAAGVATAIKVHGALMVTAWIGFVSLGVLVARYYKEAWKDSTVCGVKVWFALHRSFMILALTCVTIAVIIIFIHYEGWNSNNIHAIFGIITIVLGFLQPIMAAFRPSPDSAKRPLFNWLHFSVGTLAHLLSLVSLFLATKMAAAGLDRSFYWALAVFVVVYLFFHVLLQLHLWKTNVKKNNEINMLNMSSGGNAEANVSPKSEDKAAQQNVFRVALLCIYTVILLAILITLYVLIGKA